MRGLGIGIALLLAGCTSPSGTAPASTAPDAAAAPAPCVGATRAHISHVVVIVLENKGETSVIGSSQAPYLNRLAHACALATAYTGVAHPSLPNYLAMTGGDTFGVSDDNPPGDHRIGAASIFGQLGGSWRAYQESMAVPCQRYALGAYVPRHNPAVYFTGLTDCATNDVALPASPSFDAAFTLVTPNLLDDMHDGSVQRGDRWMAAFVPKVLASPQYQAGTLALFVGWDENDGPVHAASNQVPLILVAPSVVAGTRLTTAANHYALLATWEDLLDVPRLARAQTAPDLWP